jgi:hypothetical protein
MRRACLLSFGLLVVLVAPAAVAATHATYATHARDRGDQVVLSGDVLIRAGETAGDVVVVHGMASIAGRVNGSVVVLDGPVEVSGTVDGDVVSFTGPTSILEGARVKGDVWAARGTVRIEVGAAIEGSLHRGTPLRFLAPTVLVARLWVWVAITASTLLLGVLLLLIAPRAADAVYAAIRDRPGASVWWGVGLLIGLPLVSVVAVATLIAIPFGVGLLLALAFLYSVGYTWTAWVVGRALIRPSRHARRPRRYPALLAGWAIMRAIGFVPYLGAVTWIAGAALGLGLMLTAVWRARLAPPTGTPWTAASPPTLASVGSPAEDVSGPT